MRSGYRYHRRSRGCGQKSVQRRGYRGTFAWPTRMGSWYQWMAGGSDAGTRGAKRADYRRYNEACARPTRSMRCISNYWSISEASQKLLIWVSNTICITKISNHQWEDLMIFWVCLGGMWYRLSRWHLKILIVINLFVGFDTQSVTTSASAQKSQWDKVRLENYSNNSFFQFLSFRLNM